jgi:hypothetical protein
MISWKLRANLTKGPKHMSQGWACNFSYGYFMRILRAIRSNFEAHMVAEGPEVLQVSGKPKLILRHDIDVSLKSALKMADIENEFGIRATYMLIPNSLLYRLNDQASRDILRQLICMGHEVALHFEVDDAEQNSEYEISVPDAKIDAACKQIEEITNLPVQSISFHRPLPQFLHGPLFISGRVNAYAQKLMDWYISDSKGNWRAGEPLPKLLKPDKPLLQLLIHPIWWGEEHMSPEDRLQEFFNTETQGQSRQAIEAFDAILARTVPAVRRRYCPNIHEGGE